LENLLGATPTEDDIARSPRIIEAIRNTDINAQHFIYEMWHSTNAYDKTHVTTYVDYKGVQIKPEDVNMAHCYQLLTIKEREKYGDYWAILRRRPGANPNIPPEYMPNKVYKFVEVCRNFQRAGLPLSNSRFWVETPLNAHKVTSIYPYHPYIMGSRVNIARMNRELNLYNIPYKSEIAMGPLPNSTKMEVLVAPTMAKLLQLGIIPDDSKHTLDGYLSKLEGMIDRLRDYQTRVPFATAHAMIDAQLMRLTGIEKAVRTTVAPRLTYGRVVNNLPSVIDQATIPIAGEEGQSPTSPWNDVPSPVHSDLDTNMDRADPAGPSGNL
jgi:hypothetical protein